MDVKRAAARLIGDEHRDGKYVSEVGQAATIRKVIHGRVRGVATERRVAILAGSEAVRPIVIAGGALGSDVALNDGNHSRPGAGRAEEERQTDGNVRGIFQGRKSPCQSDSGPAAF